MIHPIKNSEGRRLFDKGALPLDELEIRIRPNNYGGEVVAYIQGFVIGNLLWADSNDIGETKVTISTISVAKPYRRRGIAKRMLLVLLLKEHLRPEDLTYANLTQDGQALLTGLSTSRV